jgi:hypothetical protein
LPDEEMASPFVSYPGMAKSAKCEVSVFTISCETGFRFQQTSNHDGVRHGVLQRSGGNVSILVIFMWQVRDPDTWCHLQE